MAPKRGDERSTHSPSGAWRGRDVLHLTMRGESNEQAVRALLQLSRDMVGDTRNGTMVVVIDTLNITGMSVGPGFMAACRELLSYLRASGAVMIVGVSNSTAVRSVASAVGFGIGIRLPIAATLAKAFEIAEEEAARVA